MKGRLHHPARVNSGTYALYPWRGLSTLCAMCRGHSSHLMENLPLPAWGHVPPCTLQPMPATFELDSMRMRLNDLATRLHNNHNTFHTTYESEPLRLHTTTKHRNKPQQRTGHTNLIRPTSGHDHFETEGNGKHCTQTPATNRGDEDQP